MPGLAAAARLDLSAISAAGTLKDIFGVIVTVAVERFDRMIFHEPEAVRAGVQEIFVMRDQNDRAAIVVDRLDQGGAAVDVEMIGRLVEN